jgi:hypothetical protein
MYEIIRTNTPCAGENSVKRHLILAAAIAALLSSAAAFGAGLAAPSDKYPFAPDLAKQNVDTFAAQSEHVRKEMEKGGRYEFIKDDDRASVEDGLNFMRDLITANGTVAAMKEDDRIRLFNRQERINALLTSSDRQRVICEKGYQPGSLFRLTTCHTVAELAARERDSKNTMEATQNHVRIGSGMGAAAGH